MTKTFDLHTYFGERRQLVDDALGRALRPAGRPATKIDEGMRYAVLQGGKRMRPLVIIAACEAAGGTAEAALPACCALEMVHAYSLVHDDLPAMDNDLERRGKPTVHVAFGHPEAILIGDALLTEAFAVLATAGDAVPPRNVVAAVRVLARHSGSDGMVGGQALDLVLGQDSHDLAALERVHALKTGALYAAAGALGALYAAADDATVRDLERWGLQFGVAFQHADDILDDDQKALRAEALARVDALVAECDAIADRLGERAAPLRAISEWVRERAHAAAAGVKAD